MMEARELGRRAEILVVDDDPGIVEILEELLSVSYQVDSAADGVEACARLEDKSYDLVLTDINMPRMNGMELIREISRWENPPLVIVITAYASMQSAIDALKLGVYDYLVKPFNFDIVLKAVQRALEKCFLKQENLNLKEMMGLYQTCEAISSQFSLSGVVKVLFRSAKMFTKADFIALYLKRPGARSQAGEFILYQRTLLRSPPGISRGLLRLLPRRLETRVMDDFFAANSSRIFTVDDCPLEEVRGDGSSSSGLSSLMAFSLKARNRQVGVLLLASLRPQLTFTHRVRRSFYMLVSRAAAAIENSYLYDNLQRQFLETVESFAQALEAKDSYTHGHSRQVALYAGVLARGLGFSLAEHALLEQAALLHDIGKIGIADTILNYPGSLTPTELHEIRQHPLKGRNILAPISSLTGLAEIVYHHHERWDGKGYPSGLGRDNIPLMARIISIADAFDAITSKRPYRVMLTLDEALEELQKAAGSQFDPELVELFIDCREELEALLQKRESLPPAPLPASLNENPTGEVLADSA